MRQIMLVVSVLIVLAAGVSAFTLMMPNTDEVTTIVQEPVVEKPVVVEEEISILDTTNPFSAPTTIAQSMKAAQPAPNVTIGDDGKIYVLYQDTVDEKTNIFLKTSTDNGQTFSEPVRVNLLDGNVALDGRVAPTIQLGDNGEVYVAWANSRYEPNMFMGNYRQLVFTSSLDDGKTFEPSITIGADELHSGKYFQHMSIDEQANEVSILAYDALGLIYYCWSSNNFQFKKEQLYAKEGFKGLHGEFFIETGNIGDLSSYKEVPTELDLPDHLVFAGESTIIKFLEDAGFKIITIKRKRKDDLLNFIKSIIKKLIGS